jgi:hypothetical protein
MKNNEGGFVLLIPLLVVGVVYLGIFFVLNG